MRNVYTRTEVPDEKCYLPSKSKEDYKVGESYDILFWNRSQLERVKEDILDAQISTSFYILKGKVTKIDEFLHVNFSENLTDEINVRYQLNGSKRDEEKYLHTWKKLVEYTKSESLTIHTGVTEEDNSSEKGITEDVQKATGRGVTEESPSQKSRLGVTEEPLVGVTEDI